MDTHRRRAAFAPLCALLALSACAGSSVAANDGGAGGITGPTGSTGPTGPATLAEQLAVLAQRAIFFEHASVGENVIEGIWALQATNAGPEPRVVNQGAPWGAAAIAAELRGGGVFFGNGFGIPNGDLPRKVGIFEELMNGGIGGAAQVAFMKPCYTDLSAAEWVQPGFDAYVAAMARLRAAHPGVTLVHVTAPVDRDNADGINAHRERYNDLLRARYRGVEPLFDLAEVEATDPAGNPVRVAGVRSMHPGYARSASDGGHLGPAGQEHVARALVAFLAALPVP